MSSLIAIRYGIIKNAPQTFISWYTRISVNVVKFLFFCGVKGKFFRLSKTISLLLKTKKI